MTPDERFVQDVMKMTALELLDLIYDNPEYLTDSYYGQFGLAIRQRYEEVRGSSWDS